MTYVLQFSDKTEQDLKFHKKSGNKVIINKIKIFLNEITEHPYTGTGKPESLKYQLSNK